MLLQSTRNLIIDNILKDDINYQFDEMDGYDLFENTIKASYEIRGLSSDEIALFSLNFKHRKEFNYEELFKLSSGVFKIEVVNDR